MKYLYFCFLILLCQCKNSASTVNADQETTTIENNADKKNGSDLSPALEEEPIDLNLNDESEDPITERTDTDLYMDPFDPDFITGRWEAEDYNEISFEAWFYVKDGYVSGQYCAVNADASRIDCGTQDDVDFCYVKSPYLVGAKKLELQIVSCYSQKKGKATIEPYGDGNLLWTVTESPGKYGVDHFAHETAVLRKVHFDPFE